MDSGRHFHRGGGRAGRAVAGPADGRRRVGAGRAASGPGGSRAAGPPGVSGGGAVGGGLAAASRVSLGLEWAFGVGFSGGDGESGADMVFWICCLFQLEDLGVEKGLSVLGLKGRFNDKVRYL